MFPGEVEQDSALFDLLVSEVEHYAIFALNPEGNVISWNEGAARIKGYDADQIIGQHFSVFYTEEQQSAGLPDQLLTEAKRNGNAQHEGWRVRADGTQFWALVSITALYDSDGDLRGFGKVTRDLTERRRRERRYEAIFNQTFQFTGLMKPNGTLIEANETALEFGGLDRDDVIGKPFWEAYWWQIDEATQTRLKEAIERAAQGEFVRYEVEVQGADENINIDFSLRPVTDEQGEVEFLIPEGRDISELKSVQQREQQLRRTREQMEYALDVTDSLIFVVDLDTEETTDYGPVKRLLGKEPDRIADFVAEIVHPDDQEQLEEMFDAIRAGDTEVFEAEFRTPPGLSGAQWIASSGYVTEETADEPACLIGLATDVTDRKRHEEQLARQNERLDNFASFVSHDLRNPLTVAKGRLELAREEFENDDFLAVNRALDRMDSLISNLLTLAREGAQIGDTGQTNLGELAEQCWNTVDTADATLSIETDRTIIADESRLRQLLENLIRNAVEHGGDGVHITIGDTADGFFVSDDGPGINEADQQVVFEAGYTTTQDGTGFGLSIVREIANAHGWDILVTDGVDGGARFEITGVEIAD